MRKKYVLIMTAVFLTCSTAIVCAAGSAGRTTPVGADYSSGDDHIKLSIKCDDATKIDQCFEPGESVELKLNWSIQINGRDVTEVRFKEEPEFTIGDITIKPGDSFIEDEKGGHYARNMYSVIGTVDSGSVIISAVVQADGSISIPVDFNVVSKCADRSHYFPYIRTGGYHTVDFEADDYEVSNLWMDYDHHASVRTYEGREATCTSEGEIEHYYCNACHRYFYKDSKGVRHWVLPRHDFSIPKTNHRYIKDPEWVWLQDENLEPVAWFTGKCVWCGRSTPERVPSTITKRYSNDGLIIYTATATVEGRTYSEIKTVPADYKVTYNGETTRYERGQHATFYAGEESDWYANGTQVAAGTRSYTWIVVEDVELTSKPTEGPMPISTFTGSERKMLENGNTKVTFVLRWSMPENCTFLSASIRRNYTDGEPETNVNNLNKEHAADISDNTGFLQLNVEMGPKNSARTINAAGFVTYEDDNKEEHTDISDIVSVGAEEPPVVEDKELVKYEDI